nr:MAG TPA: hypothetical protein [Caudoviricetes sp.]
MACAMIQYIHQERKGGLTVTNNLQIVINRY